MSEHGSDSEISVSREHAGIRKWQSKLIAKANTLRKRPDKAAEQSRKLDDDLADFFRGSPAPSPSATQTNSDHISPPRRPLPAYGDQAVNPASRPTTAHSAHSFQVAARKGRRTVGLHVRFATAQPVVIGEGGDDADLPTKDILSSSIASTHAPLQAQPPPVPAYEPGSRFTNPTNAGVTQNGNEIGRPLPFRNAAGVSRKPVATLKERRAAMEADEGTVQAGLQTGDSVGADPERQNAGHSLPIWTTKSSYPPMAAFDHFTESPRPLPDVKPQAFGNKADMDSPSSNPSSSSSMHNGDIVSLYASDRLSQSSRTNSNPRPRLSDELHLPLEAVSRPVGRPTDGHSNPVCRSPFENSDKQSSIDAQGTGRSSDQPHGNEISDDFSRFIQHWHHLFSFPDNRGQFNNNSAVSALRNCVWWFLKGKDSLERTARLEVLRQEGRPGIPDLPSTPPLQSYVDLAKAWWLMNNMIANDLPQLGKFSGHGARDLTDGLDYTTVIELSESVKARMNAYDIYLQKSSLLPSRSLTAEGADIRIFSTNPTLPPGILTLTAGVDSQTYSKRLQHDQIPFFGMLVGDTDRHFSYGRHFVTVQIVARKDEFGLSSHQCVLSIIRQRSSPWIEATLCSQDAQINLHIQADRSRGPTWDDVQWDKKSNSIDIRISADLQLFIELSEPEFEMLWSTYYQNSRVKKDWSLREGEEMIFDNLLEAFHYISSSNSSSTFPSKPLKYCRARLFEKTSTFTAGTGQRKRLNGHRLVVITPLNIKLLNHISQDFDQTKPLLFSNLRGEGDAPALLLDLRDENQRTSLILTFHGKAERTEWHSLLNDTFTSPDESESTEIKLHSFSIAQQEDRFIPASSSLPLAPGLQWQLIKVVNQGSVPEQAKTVLSESLRVLMTCNYGTLTDRLNLGPGKLQLSLDLADNTVVKLLRSEQKDMTISLAKNLLPKGARQDVAETLSKIATSSTIRSYKFHSVQDVHRFQALVTGFVARFDGVASSFSISRRRTMVSISKHVEATHTRLQIVQRKKAVQLVAFLQNFPLGRCMNFLLRGTDFYESFHRSEKYYVRFVDAKFSLPKTAEKADWEFVYLDLLEYPAEHDDIVIGFDTEAGKSSHELFVVSEAPS
ncbi:hypothetical protein MMC13_004943 [Lambiella insularis]|nr:hypothetical protein [Lambiella insularis]